MCSISEEGFEDEKLLSLFDEKLQDLKEKVSRRGQSYIVVRSRADPTSKGIVDLVSGRKPLYCRRLANIPADASAMRCLRLILR